MHVAQISSPTPTSHLTWFSSLDHSITSIHCTQQFPEHSICFHLAGCCSSMTSPLKQPMRTPSPGCTRHKHASANQLFAPIASAVILTLPPSKIGGTITSCCIT